MYKKQKTQKNKNKKNKKKNKTKNREFQQILTNKHSDKNDHYY